MLDQEFPDAAMVSEWNDPSLALRAGFDMDFYLNEPGGGYSTLMRDYYNNGGSVHGDKSSEDHSYFKKDAGGNINRFLGQYLERYEDTKNFGYISLLTCNHDTIRPGYSLDSTELKLAYAFLFTMPGVPFLYYGDEIGMKYLEVPTKEGGYFRTGSRTPMQWDESVNLGFSEADKEDLYLPVDNSEDAPTVESQESDPASLLNTVRSIIALRHQEHDLQADAPLQIVCSEAGQPFIYRRGSLICIVNPEGRKLETALPHDVTKHFHGETLFSIGDVSVKNGIIRAGAQSFAVIR
jgi:maltose alpha-D-glucosyltransferase/alpha-amylase